MLEARVLAGTGIEEGWYRRCSVWREGEKGGFAAQQSQRRDVEGVAATAL
jgi:hypothetical protein